MAMIRLATTRRSNLQPLGTAGQTVAEMWGSLVALIARELGQTHAALLAEPVDNSARGETDWYTDANGIATPLSITDPLARQAALVERQRLVADIQALGALKRGSASEGDRFLGIMLELALRVPDDDFVYVVDGRPVLVAWGHTHAGAGTAPVALTGRLEGVPTPMTILPPPRLPVVASLVRRFLLPWLLGSLLLVLLALLLAWMDPFHWADVQVAECSVAPGDPELATELRAAIDREATLRAELARVTTDAGRRRLQCPPIPADVPPTFGDVRRAIDRGAKGGRLQIVLAWDDVNDLDLHVMCPGGEEISFSKAAACGGNLDVDANGNAPVSTNTPVENVSFPSPAQGHYLVTVVPYLMRVAAQSRFRVTIRREGRPDQVVEGVARGGQGPIQVTDVEVAGP